MRIEETQNHFQSHLNGVTLFSMWSSGGRSFSHNNFLSSSHSLPININPNNQLTPPPPKSMEEVWNDITLSSLHPPRATTFRPTNLQDFLAKPFSSPPRTPSPPPLPANSISLISVLPDQLLKPTQLINTHNSFPDPSPLPESKRRRYPDTFRNSGDRRHKRMIKNRESAARSRARKQAYTNELEKEVAHLLQENARLKRQQEQLRVAVAVQPPKKNTLQRSSTAPF